MNILIILACSIIIGQFTAKSINYGYYIYKYDKTIKQIHKNDAYDNCVLNALDEWKFDDEENAKSIFDKKKQNCEKLKVK